MKSDNISKSIWIILGIFLVFLSATLLLQRKGKDQNQIQLNIGDATVIYSAPIYVATEKNFWEDEGLKVNIRPFAAGRLALDALIAGGVQVAPVADTPVVFAGLAGKDIYIIATIAETDDIKLIARKDRGIQTPNDLKGKKIAILPATSGEYFLGLLLERYGMTSADVNIVRLNPPNMPLAFARGDIDGYVAWEPYAHYGIQRLGADSVTIFSEKGMYTFPWSLVVQKEYVLKNPEVIDKLLRVMLRAEEYINKNKSEAQAITAKYVQMDIADLDSIWNYYKFSTKLDEPFLVSLFNDEARWAINSGILPRESALPDYHNMIYKQSLEKLAPVAVSHDSVND